MANKTKHTIFLYDDDRMKMEEYICKRNSSCCHITDQGAMYLRYLSQHAYEHKHRYFMSVRPVIIMAINKLCVTLAKRDTGGSENFNASFALDAHSYTWLPAWLLALPYTGHFLENNLRSLFYMYINIFGKMFNICFP